MHHKAFGRYYITPGEARESPIPRAISNHREATSSQRYTPNVDTFNNPVPPPSPRLAIYVPCLTSAQGPREEAQNIQGKKPAAAPGLKRGPGSSSSVSPSANALPPGSSFDQYSGNANASPSAASASRRGAAAGGAAASAAALNSSPAMRGGARAPPPPPPPPARADPRGYGGSVSPGAGVNGGPSSGEG